MLDIEKKSIKNFTYILRQSIVFPISSLIIIELIVITLEFIAKLIVDFINRGFNMNLPTYTLMMWTTVLLQILNILFISYVFINWSFTYYLFKPHEVVLYKGVINRKEIKYEFEHIEKIVVNQNFMGRFFNYGNLTIYSHDQLDLICITGIPNPYRHSEEILEK